MASASRQLKDAYLTGLPVRSVLKPGLLLVSLGRRLGMKMQREAGSGLREIGADIGQL